MNTPQFWSAIVTEVINVRRRYTVMAANADEAYDRLEAGETEDEETLGNEEVIARVVAADTLTAEAYASTYLT